MRFAIFILAIVLLCSLTRVSAEGTKTEESSRSGIASLSPLALQTQLLSEYLSSEDDLRKARTKDEQIEAQYNYGKTILSQMTNNIVVLDFTTSFVLVTQGFDLLTNVWDNTDIRTSWDRFFQIAGGIGSGLAAGALLLSENEEEKDKIVGGGLSLMLITDAAIPLIWGKGKETKAKENLEFLRISRSAYDDQKRFRNKMQKINDEITTFQSRLSDISTSTSNASDIKTKDQQIDTILIVMDEYARLFAPIDAYLMDV
jgi:hypothetical protein